MIYRCPLCKSEFKAAGGGNFVCPSCHERVHIGASGGTAIDSESRGKWLDAGYAVVKMSIGEGNRNHPTVGGSGQVYIDDIRVIKGAAASQ